MFIYPVTLTADKKDGGFVVTFTDIPEAITQGETEDEALIAAKDALESALDFYFEDKRAVHAAKILLLNEMIAQNVRPAELARRLHTTPQEVNRLTNVRHTTRIDGIAAALQALGKHLDMRVVES